MQKAAEAGAGCFAGGLVAFAALVGGAAVLWETRTVWFERPNPTDDFQYLDLMMNLYMGVAVVLLPVVIGGGLIGAWLVTRQPIVQPAGRASNAGAGGSDRL